MKSLEILFSSRIRAQLVRLMFTVDARALHLREIARLAGCSLSAIQREVKNLSEIAVVLVTKDGNRTYVQANTKHPFFSELTSIVRKTSGMIGLIRDAIGSDGISAAFVFGSVATETDGSNSDIDLMIIGNLGLRELVKRLTKVTNSLGREVNPHVFQANEFAKRWKDHDHFLMDVMSKPKQFLFGDEDELSRLAE